MLPFPEGGIPSGNSLRKIEENLNKLGLAHIHKSYVKGIVEGFTFQTTHNDIVMTISLPIKHDMVKSIVRCDAETAYDIACEILSDWVQSSVFLVESGQSIVPEVFLPFIYDEQKGQTLFDTIIQNYKQWSEKK